jgi:hypothetical protein
LFAREGECWPNGGFYGGAGHGKRDRKGREEEEERRRRRRIGVIKVRRDIKGDETALGGGDGRIDPMRLTVMYVGEGGRGGEGGGGGREFGILRDWAYLDRGVS